MCKSHRLGSAKRNTGYYSYWKDLRPLVNKGGYKGGYKDGLQPETLADGNWLVKQNQPVSKIETR